MWFVKVYEMVILLVLSLAGVD